MSTSPLASLRRRKARARFRSWSWRCMALATLLLASPAHALVVLSMGTSNAMPVAGGAAFSWTITMSNPSNVAPTTDIVLTDPLPQNANFLGVAVSGASAARLTCSGPASGSNGAVVCEADSLPPSGVAVVTITANYSPDMAEGVRINVARAVSQNTAAVAAIQHDVQSDASENVSIVDSSNGGAYRVRRISFANGGSSAVVNAMVANALPAEASFVRVQGTGSFHNQCDYDPTTHTILCEADFARSGQHHVTLTMQGREPLFRDSFE